MHSIRTDFRFNLLRSASKLKRGVIEKKLVGAFGFPYSWIFLPPIFLLFFFAVNRDGDIVRESFSVIFILHSLWYASRLRFYEPFFQCGFLCLFFVVCFSQPDVVNITWITAHIHRSIVDKIEPTSKDVEMVKRYLISDIKELIYTAFNWSVKILLMNRDEDPRFLTSKVEEWWHLFWKIVY